MPIDTSGLVIVAEADAASEGGGTWGGASPTVDTEFYRESTGSISSIQRGPGLTAGTYWAKSASPWLNLSGKVLYIWMNHSALAYLDTKQNGGIRILLYDGTRTAYWYVDGKDTYFGGFKCYALDVDTTPSEVVGAGTFDRTSIQRIGVIMQATGAARNATNTWVDIIRYTDKATGGVTIYGGTGGSPSTFQELVNDEVSTANQKAYGLLRPEGGALLVRGRVKIGMTSGTTSTYFKDISQVLMWENATYYLSGSGYVAMLSTASNGINLQGVSGTYPTTVYFGNSSGSGDAKVGISGCFLKAAGDAKFTFTATDANVTILGIYGCSFVNAGAISLPPYSADKDVLNSNFEGCAEILPDTCTVRNCNIIAAVDRGLRVSSTSHNVTYCNFISCNPGKAVHIPATGIYSFDNMKFSGNEYDVENSSAGLVTIRATTTTYPLTVLNSGGGSTDVKYPVNLTVTVKDNATPPQPIVGASVAIYKTSDMTQLMNEPTDSNGVATEEYFYPGSSVDITIRVRKSTSAPRYLSAETVGTIVSTGFSLTVIMVLDLAL